MDEIPTLQAQWPGTANIADVAEPGDDSARRLGGREVFRGYYGIDTCACGFGKSNGSEGSAVNMQREL